METSVKKNIIKQRKSKNRLVIVLAVILALYVFILQSKKEEVTPSASRHAPPPQLDYSILVKTCAEQAERRNHNALKSFEMEINRIVKLYEPKLQETCAKASKAASTYKSCCAVVYYLAYDKVKNTSHTETYLNSQIKPLTDSVVDAYVADINSAINQLDFDLRRSTLLLAKDLAALGPAESQTMVNVDMQSLSQASFDVALRNLGLNSMILGGFAVFDVVAFLNAGLIKAIGKNIASAAARMFGKQVAKVSVSLTLIPVDGPLPIGDILAVIGFIWTGYDIYATRKKFEKEINLSLGNVLTEANMQIHRQAIGHANTMVKRHQELQDQIEAHVATTLLGGQR